MKTNLLKETMEVLNGSGKLTSDVVWVATESGSYTWEEFATMAKDFNYDAGYGGHEVTSSLVICGVDFYMTRGEYDGSEWYEFHIMPAKPSPAGKPLNVKSYQEDEDE